MLWNNLKRKRLNRGTVPLFKIHLGRIDPPFLTCPGGTAPPIKMHPKGTQDFYDIIFCVKILIV